MRRAEEVAVQVAGIVLVGAPETVLVDEGAVGPEDTAAGRRVRKLLGALGLDVITLPLGARSLVGPSVAILSRDHPRVRDCQAWYVGVGAAPSWMNPSRALGAEGTAVILGLLGTGFAQERAGAAFRAAGIGAPAPTSAAYDRFAVGAGITRAVAAPGGTVAPPTAELDTLALLRASRAALDRCCADNGAIAASPRGQAGDADYWFFWQRDAAHVAVALGALAASGLEDELCAWAAARALAYVEFVAALPVPTDRTGFSRCTITGTAVDGYGDPQPDGPAATALAVLSLVPDPDRALAVAQPFLEFLVSGGALRPGFDLWELTVGTSFHAVNLARRALRRAAQTALTAGDPAAERYHEAATRHKTELQRFLAASSDYIPHVLDPLPAWFATTSRLDVSTIASILLAYDVDDEEFNVDDPLVSATMRRLEEHDRERWSINAAWRRAGLRGSGLGRFPEDGNDGLGTTGGSPWPVATLWAAQYHARRAERAARSGQGTGSLEESRGYVAFVLAHTDPESISEQIDGWTGEPRGVRPLAWSHAELITTLLAVDGTAEQ